MVLLPEHYEKFGGRNDQIEDRNYHDNNRLCIKKERFYLVEIRWFEKYNCSISVT